MADKNHYYVKIMSQKTETGVNYFGYYKVPVSTDKGIRYTDPISNPRSFKVVFLNDALTKMHDEKLDQRLPLLIDAQRFINKADTDKENNVRLDKNGKPFYVMLLFKFDIVEEPVTESVSFEEMYTH